MAKKIILRECYKEGQFMGNVIVFEHELTPEFIEKLKKDVNDKIGWHKHREVLEKAGFSIERDRHLL